VISLPDLLRRLRRAWAPPGPALLRVALPTDTQARLRAEVAPLLQAIAALQSEASRVRADADAAAARLLDAAHVDAERTARDAEQQAPTARAEAAKKKQDAAEADIARTLDAGRSEAARIDAAAKERLPALVERVMACVLSGAEVGS